MRFTSRYPLVPHGPKRLEIVRNRDWSDVIVRLDRVELGRIDSQQLGLMWRGVDAVRTINAHRLPLRRPPEIQRTH